MPAFALNQSRNAFISPSSRAALGASKWTCSLPTGPETTCIGPVLSSRQAPTLILFMPLRPVGNSDACHEKSLSAVSGWS